MVDDEQVKVRGQRIEYKDCEGNLFFGVHQPIGMSQMSFRQEIPSPRLKQHTDELMAELESMENPGS